MGYFTDPLRGPNCTQLTEPGREQGPGEGRRRVLVINCVRSGKDRVKDFVIGFTSSPSTAIERPVVRFVNLTGYPHRGGGAATGSCAARGTVFRVITPSGGSGGSSPRANSVVAEASGAS